MANYDDTNGVWRTIGGRRVFIREGKSLSEAMKESGKFKRSKKAESKESIEKKNSEKQIEKEFPDNLSDAVKEQARLLNTRSYDDIDDVVDDFAEEQGISRTEAKYALLKDEFKQRQGAYMDARADGSYSDAELNHMESMAKDSYFKLQEAQEQLDSFNKENKSFNPFEAEATTPYQEDKEVFEKWWNEKKSSKVNESNVRKLFDKDKEYKFDNDAKNEPEWKEKNKAILEKGYKEETGTEPYKNGKEKTSFEDYQTWRYGKETEKQELSKTPDYSKRPEADVDKANRINNRAVEKIEAGKDTFDPIEFEKWRQKEDPEFEMDDDKARHIYELRGQPKVESKTYKASDLEEGKPYEIDMGNGIKKTAIYLGKDPDGNSAFYDGEGVNGTFAFSDNFINGKVKVSDNKDDEKYIDLHSQLRHRDSNREHKTKINTAMDVPGRISENKDLAEQIIADDEWNDIQAHYYGGTNAEIVNERTGKRVKITPHDNRETLSKKIEDSYKQDKTEPKTFFDGKRDIEAEARQIYAEDGIRATSDRNLEYFSKKYDIPKDQAKAFIEDTAKRFDEEQEKRNKSNDWVRNAFNKYKKDHPKSKITLADFMKNSKK